MIIYYDSTEDLWFHTQKNEQLTLGMDKNPLPYKNTPPKSSIPFDVTCSDSGNLGPLVGILTGRNKNNYITGNKPLFKMLQTEILDNGGISVVIPLENIQQKKLKGFIYLPFERKWIKVVIPYPHVIYNRIPTRGIESTEQFRKAIFTLQEKEIHYFNPSFLNKYDLYELLQDDPELKKYVPETILINEKDSLRQFLKNHRNLYLKPTSAAKGIGLFKIYRDENGHIYSQNMESIVQFTDFDDFWNSHQELFVERKYVAQKEVTPVLYKGNRYDFRILAHYDGKEYIVTGVGVRQSEKQSLTTHIPHGGKLIAFDEVYRKKDEEFIKKVVKQCGELLSKKLGFFGEFSIDAGITSEDDYVIYEINSKPMRFDEEPIERQRIQNLTYLFHQLFKKM